MNTIWKNKNSVHSNRWIDFFLNRSYWIVAVVLIVAELIQIRQGQWIGDFWEHAAVVRELAAHPLHPINPVLLSNQDHSFFSPYLLLVSLVVRFAGTTPIRTLEGFAIINLLLFIFSFRRFYCTIIKDDHSLKSSVALILTLFFWGKDPELWSGFYHFYGLHYVLPYPSTFAICLSFLTLSSVRNIKRLKHAILICLYTALVFIVHPNTAIFLFICLVTSVLFLQKPNLNNLLLILVVILVSFCLSLMWPYFNLKELLLSQNDMFHDQSEVLYQGVIQKYWIVSLVIPCALCISFDRVSRFFLFSIVVMLFVYCLGYATRSYGLGRIIAMVVLFSQLYLAYALFKIYEGTTRIKSIFLVCYLLVFAGCLTINIRDHKQAFDFRSKRQNNYYTRFYFLRNFVKEREIVLSDQATNWLIPAISGRVVSWSHPLYNIKDQNIRTMDVNNFFRPESSDEGRRELILKYRPSFVLVDCRTTEFKKATKRWLESFGKIVYDQDSIRLIKIDSKTQSGSF